MKKIKIYFTMSVVVNVILLTGEFLLFFDSLGLATGQLGFSQFGFTIFIAVLILLPTTVVLLLWGLWLRFVSKIRNKFIATGIDLLYSFNYGNEYASGHPERTD